jgi:hypothetical protein
LKKRTKRTKSYLATMVKRLKKGGGALAKRR